MAVVGTEERRRCGQRREKEVCRLFFWGGGKEADLDRGRGLDTLRLWRDTVTAAVDCVRACLCMFTEPYMMCGFIFFYAIKTSPNPLKSRDFCCVCVGRKEGSETERWSQ